MASERPFWSASPLADSDQICSVGIRLHGGVLAWLGNVYAPVASHGNQAQFFWALSQWMDLPAASLIPGRAESLGAEVLSQHAPVLCDVPCANALADRIAWWIPPTVTLAWTPFLVEEFRAHLAWQLWRYIAFGLDGQEDRFRPVKCAVLGATLEGQELRSLMASKRRLSRRPACAWTLDEHEQFETLEQQLSTLVQSRRRRLLSAWKVHEIMIGLVPPPCLGRQISRACCQEIGNDKPASIAS